VNSSQMHLTFPHVPCENNLAITPFVSSLSLPYQLYSAETPVEKKKWYQERKTT